MISARDNHRFFGREITREDLSLIQEVVGSCGGISRTELSHTVCELLDWKRANGRLKARECLDLLQRLEGQGLLKLPENRQSGPRKGTRRHKAPAGDETEPPWVRLNGAVWGHFCPWMCNW